MLELGAELIRSDIIAFYELVKNGFDAGSKKGVEVSFDIVLPRHACLKLVARIERGGDLEQLKSTVRGIPSRRVSGSTK